MVEQNKLKKTSHALELLHSRTSQIETLLEPSGTKISYFIECVVHAFNKFPRLDQAVPKTVIFAVMEAAKLGLIPDGKQCSIVPYKNKKTGQLIANFQIGYLGIVDLAYRSGNVKAIWAENVFKADEDNEYKADMFEYEKGTDQRIKHIPMGNKRDEDITHSYAVAELKNGAKIFEVLTRYEIEKIRAVSPARSEGPWVQWYGQMCKKCPTKRLDNYLPYSTLMNQAREVDDVPEAMLTVNESRYQIPGLNPMSNPIPVDLELNDAEINQETGEIVDSKSDENGQQTQEETGSVAEEVNEHEKEKKKKSKSDAMKKAWETRKANEAKKQADIDDIGNMDGPSKQMQAILDKKEVPNINEAVETPVLVKSAKQLNDEITESIKVESAELISKKTLDSIIEIMASGKGGLEAVEYMKKYEDTTDGEMKKLTEKQGQDVLNFLQEKNEGIPY